MKRSLLLFLGFHSFLWSTTPTSTWNGSSSSMNAPANWAPPGVPTSGVDLLNFPPTTTLNLTPNNDIGTYTLVNSSTLNCIGLTTPTNNPYQMTGNPFQVASGGAALINIGGPGSAAPYNLSSSIANNILLNNGTLYLNGAHYDLLSGVIQNTGTVVIQGGSLKFSGANTYSGATNITSGTLQLGANGTLPSATNVTIGGGGILDLNNFTQTIGVLSGSGNIYTEAGSLTITNSGTNTYSGNINFSTQTLTGAGGTLVLAGGGTLTISGANSYSSLKNPGATTVNAGTLIGTQNTSFGNNSDLTIASGATLNISNATSVFGSLSGAGTLAIGTGSATFSKGGTSFTGSITGTGTGAAEGLTYSGSNTLTLSGTNSYTGTTVISGGGTLAVSSLSSSVAFQVSGGTLQFLSSVTGTASQGISLSAATGHTSTLDLKGNSVSWAGAISGGGALILNNSGGGTPTLTLSGNNNYSGGTTLNGGTLLLNSSTAFPVSGSGTPLTIAAGATLNMNNNSINVSTLSGSTGSAILLGSGTLTAFGGTTGSSSNFSGNISGTGGLTFSGNGTTLLLTGTNSYSGPTTINLGGTVGVTSSGLTSSPSSSIAFSGSGGTLKALAALSSGLPISLGGSGTFDTGTYTSTWSGTISGSSNFTVTGTGTLILSPTTSNTYMGSTIVSSGTLQAGNSNSPFGMTTLIDVKPNATVDFNDVSTSISQLIGDPGGVANLGTMTSTTLTITGGVETTPYYGIVSGSGNLALTGGTPSFLGTDTFTGTTTIRGGATFNTLNLGSSSSIIFGSGGGTLQIGSTSSSTASLVLNDIGTISTNTYNLTMNGGSISGSGASLTKIGQGTLTLTGTNSFANILYLEGGVLNVTSASLGSPSSLTFQNFSGTLQSSGSITSSIPVTLLTTGVFDTTSGDVTLSGNITNPPKTATKTGYGGLTKTGTGTLTLTGMNSYAGLTTIENGTLIASSTSLPLPGSNFAPMMVFDGTAPIFQASSAFSSFPSVVFLTSGTIDTGTNMIATSSVIAGNLSATFTKAGSQTMLLRGDNIYTGPTNITAGTLQAGTVSTGTSGAFGVDSAITIASGATMDLAGYSNTIGSLSGPSGGSVTLGSGTLTIKGNSTTYSGDITGGTGGVALTSGTQTLSGTNTYTGATQISSGATLQIKSSPSTSIGSLSNSGALLADGTVNCASYTQAAGVPLTLDFLTGSTYGNIVSTGAITLDSANTSILNITNSGLVSPTGTITLLQGSSLSHQFTIGQNAFPQATINYTATELQLDFSMTTACRGTWVFAGDENWGVSSNWSTMTCYPGANGATIGDTATFSDVMSTPAIMVTLSDGSSALASLNLNSISFNAPNTNYTIVKSGATITSFIMDGPTSSNPTIAVSAGDHSLEGQIQFNQDGTLELTGGSLTLPSTSSLIGASATLTVGGSSGVLDNSASVTIKNVAMSGGTINNSGSFTPSTSFTQSGGTFTNQSGATLGSSTPSVTFSGGTFTNQSGATLGSSSTSVTISGGQVDNQSGSTMQAGALSLTSGTLTTQNPVNVSTYSQQTNGSLVLDFPTIGTYGEILATGDLTLAGSLTLTNSGSVTPPTSGNLVLLQGTSLNSTTFTTVDTSVFPSGSLKYSSTQVYLLFGSTSSCNGVWASTASSGNWGAASSWKACVPGITSSTQDTATFGNVVGAPSSIAVTLADSSGTNALAVALNKLSFTSSSSSYSINQTGSNQGSITLEGTSPAQIIVSAGSHTINAPISLKQNTSVTLSNAATLTLGSIADVSIGSGTPSFSVGGTSGTLINHATISPTTASVSGGTFNNYGTFTPATSLSISGGVVTNETGATLGTAALSISGGELVTEETISVTSYTQTAGILTLDFPTTSPYGNIAATGALSLGGELNITNSGSVSFTSGTTVNLLQGASLTGTFSSIINAFPDAVVHVSKTLNKVYLNFGGFQGTWSSISTSNDYWGLTSNWNSLTNYPGQNPATAEDTATFADLSGAPADMIVTMTDSAGTAALDLTALYELNFNAVNTSFTINQYGGGGGSITMNGTEAPASISVSGGSHTLNAPVTLAIDTVLQLTGGTLAFGSAAAVTDGGSQTLTIQGAGGTWNNSATISPNTLFMEEGTINNYGTISPTTLTIAAPSSETVGVANYNTITATGAISIDGSGTTSVANFVTMSSGSTFVIGQTGAPSVFNSNTLSAGSSFAIEGGAIANSITGKIYSTTDFTISGGTISNSYFGSIFAPPGQTMTITGGVIANQSLSAIGSQSSSSLASNLIITGGTIANESAFALAETVQFSGGAFTNTAGGYFLSQGGDLTISGGSITNGAGSYLLAVNGSLTITGGSLTNNGTVASDPTITISGGTVTNNAGATFSNSSTDIVFTGGTLITSETIGAANYTQSGSSTTLQTNILSTNSFGNIAASGIGTIGGNLVVYADPGISLIDGDKINLLTAAGGRSAEFTNVSFQNFPPSLIPSIVYLTNGVQLDVRGTNPTPSHGSFNSVVFSAATQHNNFITLQMMHMRDRMAHPAPASLASRYLPYSIDELMAENEEIEVAAAPEPEEVLAQQPGIIQKTAQLSQRVEKEGFPWSAYVGPIGSFGNVKTKGAQLGLGFATAGALAGVDKILEDEENRPFRAGVGALLEYRKIWTNVYQNGGSGSADRIHGSLYGTTIPKSMPNLAIEGVAGFAFHWDDFVRNTGIDQTSVATGSTTESIFDVLLGFEYSISGREHCSLPCDFTFVPLMTWQYVYDYVASYTESGAGIYDLHYNSYTPMSLTSLLGARFQYLVRGRFADLRVELDAGWQYEYLNRALAVTASAFSISSGSISSTMVAPGRNSLVCAIDLLGLYNGGWTVEVNSTYTLNSLFYDLFFYVGFGREF